MARALTVHVAIIIIMRNEVYEDEARTSAPSHVDVQGPRWVGLWCVDMRGRHHHSRCWWC